LITLSERPSLSARKAAEPQKLLDLRTNTGGDGMEGMQVAGYFFNEKVPMATIVTRTGKPPSALFGLVSLPKVFEAGEQGHRIYSNPVVIPD
jgi:hypothetical protein